VDVGCVFFEAETEYLNIMKTSFSFRELINEYDHVGVQFVTIATNRTTCQRKGIFIRCRILICHREWGNRVRSTEFVWLMGRAELFTSAPKYFLKYYFTFSSVFMQERLQIS
jgi:hypothetical protein